MSVIGPIRFDRHQVKAARAGWFCELRAKAWRFDPASNGRKPTPEARARAGDAFWVGEPVVHWRPLRAVARHVAEGLVYEADSELRPDHLRGVSCKCRHIPADRMRRQDSRLTLLVATHRLTRLDDLTAAEAEACGARHVISLGRSWYTMLGHPPGSGETPQAAFLAQWAKRHGRMHNPEIAVIGFRLVGQNADAWAAAERAA